MAEKPPWFDGAVGGMLDQVREENRNMVASIQEDNRKAMKAIGGQVEEIKKEQATQKVQIHQLQKDVASVQNRDLVKMCLCPMKSQSLASAATMR